MSNQHTVHASPKPGLISQEERCFVVLFGLAVVVVTSIPYVIAFSTQEKDFIFTGFLFGITDGNSYIAKMLSGWAGSWFFRTPYTAYPQAGLPFFYLPYLILGKLAAPPALHTQLVVLFHLFRGCAALLLAFAAYAFLARFIAGVFWRRLGLIIVLLGGGLGWLLVIGGKAGWGGSLPLDFYSPEAFGFLSLYGIPHMSMSRALMLWALLAYLDLFELAMSLSQTVKTDQSELWKRTARLSILWLLAGFFNPLTLTLVGVLIIFHLAGVLVRGLIQQRRFHPAFCPGWRQLVNNLVIAGLAPSGFLLYYFLISRFDDFARVWNLQNITRSPGLIQFLLAYGIVIPFSWIGARRLLKREFNASWLVVGWVIIFPILAYAPIELQRRLIEGVWIAWVTLTMAAFDPIEREQTDCRKNGFSWWLAPLALTSFSAVFLLVGGIQSIIHPTPPVFLPKDEAALFETLQDKAYESSVVLASFDSGNALPAWAPVFVLTGHGPESIHFTEVNPQIEEFYQSSTPDSQRLALIEKFSIRFILWGPDEHQSGNWQPADAVFLQEFARKGDFFLYEYLGHSP